VQTTANGSIAEAQPLRHVVDSMGRRADYASASRFADVLVRLAESRENNDDPEDVSDGALRRPRVRRGAGGFFTCFKCGEQREIRRGFVCCSACRARPPSHPRDARFDCGDAWNKERFVRRSLIPSSRRCLHSVG
jgi:hypothetical protein